MTYTQALERKGVKLSMLDEAAEEFRPTETTLNGSRAWSFKGSTSQSLDKLVDRFLDKRPHYRGEVRELPSGEL